MKTPTALLDSHETAQRSVRVEQTGRFSGLPEGLPLEDFCSQLLCGAAADRNKEVAATNKEVAATLLGGR